MNTLLMYRWRMTLTARAEDRPKREGAVASVPKHLSMHWLAPALSSDEQLKWPVILKLTGPHVSELTSCITVCKAEAELVSILPTSVWGSP